VPRDKLIRLRRDVGTPANGALFAGEPAFDMTPAAERLLIGDPAGNALVLADPARIAALEARVRLLERAVRDLQFTAWVGLPTNEIPP
jgi:hypothetical protein